MVVCRSYMFAFSVGKNIFEKGYNKGGGSRGR